MAFPGSIDAPDVTMQGTTLFTGDDHALQHRQAGSSIVNIETFLGTNSGTNVFGGFTNGMQVVSAQSGTLGTLVTKGTINNGIFGSMTATGGTIAGQIQNNGTIANGVYGTSQMTGGTIGTAQIAGGTISTTTVLQPLKSAFMAFPGTAGQVFGTNALAQLNFGSLSYDLLSEFGTATNSFIALTSGLYFFGLTININGGGGNLFNHYIRLNGTAQSITGNGTAGGAGVTLWQGSVPAGGTIDCAIFNNSTSVPGTVDAQQGTASFFGKRVF